MSDANSSVQVPPNPPDLPSKHVYWSLSLGIVLPLVIAFLVWRRLETPEFTYARLWWSLLWTYPAMLAGCVMGEILARKISADFYASLGDNPGQLVNITSGWFWAHLYLILLVALFFAMRSTPT